MFYAVAALAVRRILVSALAVFSFHRKVVREKSPISKEFTVVLVIRLQEFDELNISR